MLLKVVTSQGYIFVFQTEYAEIISDFINWIIKEMKKFSKYTTAISDYVPPGISSARIISYLIYIHPCFLFNFFSTDENFLALSKGDLIQLMDSPSHETEWLKGKAVSGDVGEFPSRVVDVLPINNTPTKHLLVSSETIPILGSLLILMTQGETCRNNDEGWLHNLRYLTSF
jgi:hypothetical protein